MIGQTVSHYNIVAELGRGAMGVVYRARDERLGRDVALKFLPTGAEDDEARARFLTEARAASALDHPNICTIHDIGQIDGPDGKPTTFIVMAHYAGSTLKERLASEDPPGVDEAASIAYQVASGLAAAHASGIVHRDIKPANIIVTDTGVVKILDFGLAKLGLTEDLTQAGSTLGTPSYMSPEQVQGEPVDGRTDIWSLGVVLYEMLAGQKPFDGQYDQAVMYGIVHTDPESLETIRPDVPGELIRVVELCLKKDVSDRYADAASLASSLQPLGSVAMGTKASIASAGGALPRETPGPDVTRTVLIFAAAAILVLAGAYVATMRLGLPDWVVPVAGALMVAGLPIILLARRADRRRDRGQVGFRGPRFLDRFLTMRRAALGGVVAIATLAVITGAYSVMRTEGIGPFGTLIAKGTLDRQPTLVVAEFQNATTDSTLAHAITEALRIDLSQSPAVRIMEPNILADALRRMGAEPVTRLPLTLAREVAIREGASAVVSGGVSGLGSGYSMTLSLLTPQNDEILSLRETARGPDEVIEAVARLSTTLRERIGESLRDIRASVPLPRVTTRSLDALRLYTEANNVFQSGDQEGAIPLLESAIERDSTFAMAYRRLAVALLNTESDPERAREAGTKAYQLRNRLPELERLITVGHYFTSIDPNLDERIAAYETVLKRDSSNLIALNNLSLAYRDVQRFGDAERLAIRASEAGNSITFFQNRISSQASQGAWDRVEESLAVLRSRDLESAFVEGMHGIAASAVGDYAKAESLFLRVSSGDGPLYFRKGNELGLIQIYRLHGQLDRAEQIVQLTRPAEVTRETLNDFLEYEASALDMVSVIRRDREAAITRLEQALEQIPFDDLDPEDRPYWFGLTFHADLGQVAAARRALELYLEHVPERRRRYDDTEAAGRAFILLAEGDFEGAIIAFDEVIASPWCYPCRWPRRGRALALEAAGRLDEAIADFRFVVEVDFLWRIFDEAALLPDALERLGGLYEQTGQYDEAVAAYTRFAELWKDADPELQPRVREALQRIDAILTREARSET